MAFTVRFHKSNYSFKTKFGQINTITKYVGGELYQGSYEVTPQVEPQTLYTAQKVLEDDVKINKIPYYEVSNNSGGTTVSIGNEV